MSDHGGLRTLWPLLLGVFAGGIRTANSSNISNSNISNSSGKYKAMTGFLTLDVFDHTIGRQVGYRYPHPDIPTSVMHAVFSNWESEIEAPLVIAGTFYGDPRQRQFLLSTGCTTENLPVTRGSILVLVRGQCAFAVKAQNSYNAGAVGLVVVDNCDPTTMENCRFEVAPIMSLGHASVSVGVLDMPAIAITEAVGVSLLTLAMTDQNVRARISFNSVYAQPNSDGSEATISTGEGSSGHREKEKKSSGVFGHFVLFSGAITITMLALMALMQYRHNKRRQRQVQQWRQALLEERRLAVEAVLEALPAVEYEAPDNCSMDSVDLPACCVCLEPYKSGSRVRKLPCKHEFHQDCIDPWLTENVTCPLCKDDVYVATGVHEPPAIEETDTAHVTLDAPPEGAGDDNADEENEAGGVAHAAPTSRSGSSSEDPSVPATELESDARPGPAAALARPSTQSSASNAAEQTLTSTDSATTPSVRSALATATVTRPKTPSRMVAPEGMHEGGILDESKSDDYHTVGTLGADTEIYPTSPRKTGFESAAMVARPRPAYDTRIVIEPTTGVAEITLASSGLPDVLMSDPRNGVSPCPSPGPSKDDQQQALATDVERSSRV